MVQGEDIDSGISNFQLDNRFGRNHHSLAHLSKFTVAARSGMGGQPAGERCHWRRPPLHDLGEGFYRAVIRCLTPLMGLHRLSISSPEHARRVPR
jgi:hypothetical protein